MSERWVDLEDVYIDRDHTGPFAIARDTEGEELYRFPRTVSDSHIRIAIMCANHAYRCGFSHGRRNVSRMLREIMDITEARDA